MKTFLKLAALLIAYPEEGLADAVPVLAGVVDNDATLTARERDALGALVDELAAEELLDVQERYVALFDRSRALSLHLFEHVHGESRDRGQAMVDLISLYQEAGLSPVANELPDYLPMFLEYLATLPEDQAGARLGDVVHILDVLRDRLADRAPQYAELMACLIGRADRAADASEREAVIAVTDDPEDLEALDAAWEETPVRFDGSSLQAGCPSASGGVPRAQPQPVVVHPRTSGAPARPQAGQLPAGVITQFRA